MAKGEWRKEEKKFFSQEIKNSRHKKHIQPTKKNLDSRKKNFDLQKKGSDPLDKILDLRETKIGSREHEPIKTRDPRDSRGLEVHEI